MSTDQLLSRLGIRYPIFEAPMAGGPSTPELAAAVSNAGGLGALGTGYQTPAQIAADIRRVRSLTDRAFNVNMFCLDYRSRPVVDPSPMLEILREIHTGFELPPPEAPAWPTDPFPAQFEAVLEARPPVFSFTFGIPPASALSELRARGTLIIGTATTLEEACLLQQAGVDAIVAQGAEAGAHRGTFAGPFEQALVSTLGLVRAVAAAVPLPVIASGGLMDRADVVRALESGATAVQMGTAFLPCPESGAPEVHKRAILEARTDTTVITRAFSGRPARGLANEFSRRLAGHEPWILPYPLQNTLTRPLRAAAAQRGRPEFLSLWAGQGVTRARQVAAANLVRDLAGI